MENIDHANRFFWARVPIFIFLLPTYLYKSLSLKKLSKNYARGGESISEERRFEQLLSFYRRDIFFKNLSFHFFFNKKVTKQQTVFVVDDNLDWNSLMLVVYLIRYHDIPFPRFLLNNIFIDKKEVSVYWYLIDTFYGEQDLDRAIESKRPFFVERSFLERHEEVLDKIKSSHVAILPIACYRKRPSSVWYSAGELVKTSGYASFKKEALKETIKHSFEVASKKLKDVAESENKNVMDKIKSLFRI